MTHRRHALLTLLGGLGTLASCRTAPRPTPAGASPVPPDSLRESRDFARRLLADFRRTSSRTYSEEGIPVFLAGENPAGDARRSAVAVPHTDGLCVRLAADLRRGAAVLAREHRATTVDDVGKLVEVLAERDFGTLRDARRP